jgi:hypothetical protein
VGAGFLGGLAFLLLWSGYKIKIPARTSIFGWDEDERSRFFRFAITRREAADIDGKTLKTQLETASLPAI